MSINPSNHDTNLIQAILDYKKKYQDQLIIPAHHYQEREIVRLSDFVGDSYGLAVQCSRTEARFIVFCGVRFMAEGASILAKNKQKVILPELMAGCPMADMIDEKTAFKAYQLISGQCRSEIIPIVYMNSYADMKSFCGQRGGAVCTSSNAKKIVHYYLEQGKAVFFFPDFNLGINTADQLGLKPDQIVRVKKDTSLQKLTDQCDLNEAKLFLWDGFCHVHKEFQVRDIMDHKAQSPDIKVIVHPECDHEVVKNADDSGSTQKIYQVIQKAPPGSKWAVGTEYHFVDRIAAEFPDKIILPLKKSVCFNMEKLDLQKLLMSLQSIDEYLSQGSGLKYEIRVPEEYKENAGLALQKMIKIVEGDG